MAVDESWYSRGKCGKGLLLNELLDVIEEDDSIAPDTIVICPPNEPRNAETDIDSDLSDEEVTGNVNHLPRRILRSMVQVRYDHESEYSNKEDNLDIPSTSKMIDSKQKRKKTMICKQSQEKKLKTVEYKQKTKRTTIRKRSQNKNLNWMKASSILESEVPNIEDFLGEQIKSPFDAFSHFFTNKLLEHIVIETKRYAAQKLVHNFTVNENEILTFIGVMLLSGYHSLPYRRLYWNRDPDVHCPLVSDAIRRNRFEEILRFLHLADNESNDNTDSMYKVRPLFDHLNSSFKQLPPRDSISIDESIIPYYGRHSNKQFIKGKPIRFGFKLWVAADPSGYVLHSEPYCGASTRIPDVGLGQGGNVVIGLAEQLDLKKGTKIYFDNLFTSVKLLEELTRKGLGGTGTTRENRCNASMTVPEKKVFQKTPRGSMTTSSTGNLLLLRWNDNSVVTVLTNCDEFEPLKTAKRYNRIEKRRFLWKFQVLLHAITTIWEGWIFLINFYQHIAQESDLKNGGGLIFPGLLTFPVLKLGYYIADLVMPSHYYSLDGNAQPFFSNHLELYPW